jgi:small GTP-binding protein
MADTSEANPKYKAVVCGTTNTGKTSLIGQRVDGVFIPARFPTALPLVHSLACSDAAGEFELAIWDTAGVEEWITRNSSIYHSSQIVIFVAAYDVAESLQDLVAKWVPILSEHIVLENCVRVLAVNKSDIIEEGRITESQIADTRERLGAELFSVSAKDGTNVAELFLFVASAVRERFPPPDPRRTSTRVRGRRRGRGGCC